MIDLYREICKPGFKLRGIIESISEFGLRVCYLLILEKVTNLFMTFMDFPMKIPFCESDFSKEITLGNESQM
jgi:hypothetical protein